MPALIHVKLQPDPALVFEYAHAAVEFRYRLVVNYLNADTDRGETPPAIVREVFHRLLAATSAINEGRPEDRKTDSHVVAARALADRFEREWLNKDHRAFLTVVSEQLIAIELTTDDWTDIRRVPDGGRSEDAVMFSTSRIQAQLLHGSSFGIGAWQEYMEKVSYYEGTFDPPCRKICELARVLAGVCYPDPASYVEADNTIPNFDDEHLIKRVNSQVKELISEIQALTNLVLTDNPRFDPIRPVHSAEKLFHEIETRLRGWSGAVTLPPESDRPRWYPTEPGSAIGGILTFCGKKGTVPKNAKLIMLIFEAFEAVSWQSPIPLPKNPEWRVLNQSLKRWKEGNDIPIKFYIAEDGGRQVRWSASDEPSDVLEIPGVEALMKDNNISSS